MIAIRASASTAFRQPSLSQINAQIVQLVDIQDYNVDGTAKGGSAFRRVTQSGSSELKAEESDNFVNVAQKHSKKDVIQFKDIFTKIEGRAIVATFASNVHRVQQIVEASVATKRKIAVYGRSMLKTLEVGSDMGYIKAPAGTFIEPNSINKYPANKVTIICTGSQGEPLAALSRIAAGTHRQISLHQGDTVIFSSSPIPGNQQGVSRTINMLFRRGANVIINSPLTDTHTSGHGGQEEQKLMLKLTSPKYFMPIHGEYRMLKIHSNLGYQTGVRRGRGFVLDNGEVLAVTKNTARAAGKVQAGNVYIDGTGIGDIGNIVIRDRKLLSEDGLLSAIVTIDKKNMRLIGSPVIISRGFIYMKEHSDLTSEISGVSFLLAFFSTLKSSEVSSLPNLIFFVISFLFLQTLTSTVLPTSVWATIIGSSFISFILVLLNSRIISPSLIPALSDGLFSATLATKAPLGSSKFSISAIS